MKQLTLTVPNSINDSLNAIETLRFHGTLTELACRLLEMLYIAGWEDGFVALDRPNIPGLWVRAPRKSARCCANLKSCIWPAPEPEG